ncbi:MAG: polymorphic toxin-type HINT domain-containing protein [Candidatus Dependentiae bacterium]|nr:polymorphic toxin-type HINT domain-containing protein [Candidatus Dependentiae bacterium]
MKLSTLLYALLFVFPAFIFAGFPSGTQVKIPGGYKSIEKIKIGDLVFAIKPDGHCAITSVVQVASYTWHKYMLIEIDDSVIISVTGQRFYNPIENRWIKAKHIQKDIPLLSGMNDVLYVRSVKKIYEPIEIFDIRLKDVHTFCIGDRDIVVHNFLQLTIGFSIAWGCGVMTFEAFWQACIVGLVAIGLRSCSSQNKPGWKTQAYVHTPAGGKSCEVGSSISGDDKENPAAVSYGSCPGKVVPQELLRPCNHANLQSNISLVCPPKEQADASNIIFSESRSAQLPIGKNISPVHNYPISQHSPGKDCGTISCDPPPKGPNGYFIPAPYHPEYATPGCKSTGPSWHDGQKALDASVEVENKSDKEKKQRVVVYGGKYIVFDQTSPGVYHGHHRLWGKKGALVGLTPKMQNALIGSGMVKDNKGKIIKDAKNNNGT